MVWYIFGQVQFDVVINVIGFVVFLLGVEYQFGVLDEGGVVVLQVVFFLFFKEGWEVLLQGFFVCDFVMYVLLIEIDGCVMMWVVFFKVVVWFDEWVQVNIVLYVLEVGCVGFVVDFVVNWVWFRCKFFWECCVVIVMVNYLNCDGWFGNGVGFDMLVGIVEVLKVIVGVGYLVMDILMDGDKFMDFFMVGLMNVGNDGCEICEMIFVSYYKVFFVKFFKVI